MAFRVEFAPQAFDDLDSIAEYIGKNSGFGAAEKWFRGIIGDITSLREMPARCPVAPESEELGAEVRLLLHGSSPNRTYKIYFSLHAETPTTGTIRVLHVRHWARRGLSIDELQELMDESDEYGGEG